MNLDSPSTAMHGHVGEPPPPVVLRTSDYGDLHVNISDLQFSNSLTTPVFLPGREEITFALIGGDAPYRFEILRALFPVDRISKPGEANPVAVSGDSAVTLDPPE
jgi:hypothetical protein